MPVHVNVLQETVNCILGKVLMKSAYLDLIVHAHWAEHEIEEVEQYHAYRDAFLLIGTTFAKKLYDIKAIKKS